MTAGFSSYSQPICTIVCSCCCCCCTPLSPCYSVNMSALSPCLICSKWPDVLRRPAFLGRLISNECVNGGLVVWTSPRYFRKCCGSTVCCGIMPTQINQIECFPVRSPQEVCRKGWKTCEAIGEVYFLLHSNGTIFQPFFNHFSAFIQPFFHHSSTFFQPFFHPSSTIFLHSNFLHTYLHIPAAVWGLSAVDILTVCNCDGNISLQCMFCAVGCAFSDQLLGFSTWRFKLTHSEQN